MTIVRTREAFGQLSQAMRPCAKCGAHMSYQKFDAWPDLGPNVCDPCGSKMDAQDHDKAMKAMEAEMIENSRIPECYSVWDDQEAANRRTKAMFEWLMQCRDASMYWGGVNGVGKTHTVCNVGLKLIRDTRASVRFYSCSKWLTLLMQLKQSDNNMFNHEVQLAATCGIVIFDDIGKEKPTEAKLESLYNVIDLRDQQNKATWFTSNYQLSQLPDRCGDNYGNAIKVRIERMCGQNVIK